MTELPQVDLTDVDINSKDYLYWKAVTYEVVALRRSEKNSFLKQLQDEKDQYLIEEKNRQL